MALITAVIYGKPKNHFVNFKTYLSIKKFSKIKIVIVNNLENLEINSINSQYVFFVKNGDFLSRDSQSHINPFLDKNYDLIYSDEIMYFNRKNKLKFFKPDFSYDTLLSINYLRNLLIVKTDLLKLVGNLSSYDEKTCFYDLILKIVSKTKNIGHIAQPIYISKTKNRVLSYDSFYENYDYVLAEAILKNFLFKNENLPTLVHTGIFKATTRVKREINGSPLISIIIPFKDQSSLLFNCLNSILSKTTYKNFEIIGINNASCEKQTFTVIEFFKKNYKNITFFDCNIPFNYSKLNNIGVNEYARGEYLVLLNNDTEVISHDWIESLLEHAQRDDVGVVGAKLLYSDNTIQHAGIVTTLHDNYTGHIFRNLKDDESGYFFMPNIVRSCSALTFACVMIKRKVFDVIGGLNEELAVAYNDVDFCLQVLKKGYINVYTPYAKLYHYESKSRGLDDTQQKKELVRKERDITIERNKQYFLEDKYYNKNLTIYYDDARERCKDPDKLRSNFLKRLHRKSLNILFKIFINSPKELTEDLFIRYNILKK